jgi:polyadenylate-binding protein
MKGRPMRIMWSQRDPSLRKSGVGNIFIKNLDKNIDNKQLYDTFNQFGNILSCKIVKDDKASSKGYGFVHFESEEAALQAIQEVNGMMLADRKVFVGRFKNRGDRVRETGEKNKQYTNVFIKNLPEDYTEEQLKDLVAGHGNTVSVKLMANDDTGKSKCFGFCSYASHEEADAAVKAIHGIEVKDPKLNENKELYAGRAQKKVERIAELRINYEKRKQDRQQKYAGVNLYVKNLDDEINDEILRKEFAAHGTITSAKVMVEGNGSSKGFGFVCFSSPEEATKAASEMNGRIVGSKPLYVAMAQRKEDRKAHLQQQYMRGAGPTNGIRQPMAQPGFGNQGYPYSNQQMNPMQGFYNIQPSMNSPGPKTFGQMPMPQQRLGMPGRPQGPYNMRNMMNPTIRQQSPMMPHMRPNNMGPYGNMNMARANVPMNMMQNINPMRAPGPYGGQGPIMNPTDLQNTQNYKIGHNVRNPMQDFNNTNINNMAVNPNHVLPNQLQNTPAQSSGLPGHIGNPAVGNPHAQISTDVNNNAIGDNDNINIQNNLDAQQLARVSTSEQKQLIGEKLYPIVKEYCGPDDAGKVTGMILELENEELLSLLEKQHLVREKVMEAKNVLERAMKDGQQAQEAQ